MANNNFLHDDMKFNDNAFNALAHDLIREWTEDFTASVRDNGDERMAKMSEYVQSLSDSDYRDLIEEIGYEFETGAEVVPALHAVIRRVIGSKMR